ncbi:MAG: 30S ribosomal protein S21 [Candidatus Vidania fulgoroideorum]
MKIKKRKMESFEKMYKRFKKKLKDSNVLEELKKRRFYNKKRKMRR